MRFSSEKLAFLSVCSAPLVSYLEIVNSTITGRVAVVKFPLEIDKEQVAPRPKRIRKVLMGSMQQDTEWKPVSSQSI